MAGTFKKPVDQEPASRLVQTLQGGGFWGLGFRVWNPSLREKEREGLGFRV